MPETYKSRWLGLDFGFNDPTALVEVRLSEGKLWLDEVIYRQHMTNPEIYNVIKSNGLTDVQVVADSAEPKSIEELRRLGTRIEPARKGADSVRVGIATLQRYTLCVTRESANIRKELSNYKWKVDGSGDITNEPCDMFNHSLDAVRYVALNKLLTPPKMASIKIGKL
jgi:phage terminase large subunit